MTKHFHRDIENLNAQLLALSALTEEMIDMAARCLCESDREQADEVITTDRQVDRREVQIEEECLKILALYQPVAVDLRFIVAVLKINNDLERIGDLAVNIAERAEFLATQERINIPFDFSGMARKAKSMLKRSLDALMKMDALLARGVCASDDEVDAMNREMYLQVQDGIRNQPEHLESLIHLLSASRHLERIADHATNIAEDVLYMIKGEIVRHRAEDYKSLPLGPRAN